MIPAHQLWPTLPSNDSTNMIANQMQSHDASLNDCITMNFLVPIVTVSQGLPTLILKLDLFCCFHPFFSLCRLGPPPINICLLGVVMVKEWKVNENKRLSD